MTRARRARGLVGNAVGRLMVRIGYARTSSSERSSVEATAASAEWRDTVQPLLGILRGGSSRRRNFLLLLVVAVVTQFSCTAPVLAQTERSGLQLKAGMPLAPFAVHDISGRLWTDRDLRGRFTVAVIWSSHCLSCLRELEEVSTFYDNATKAGGTLSLITISLDGDEARTRISTFLEKNSARFPVLLGKEWFSPEMGVPTTLLIDDQVRIKKIAVGVPLGEPRLGWRARVDHLLLEAKFPRLKAVRN